ncbi:MAG: glycosyltransferase family 4 protein [Myxococcota bacterium]
MAKILYLSSEIPALSETFVYREVLALRSLGLDIETASVRSPASDLGEDALTELAQSTRPIYSLGFARTCADVLSESRHHFVRTLSTLSRVMRDALFSTDVSATGRPKVVWQGLAAIGLASRLRSTDIGHIHCHFADVPTTIGMYVALQLGITFSFTGHANDLFPGRSLLKEKLQRALFVNCISAWHRRFYQSIVARDDDALPIVRCGVDLSVCTETPAPAGDSLRVLGVGRLVPKKGFDVLLRAVRAIALSGGPSIQVTLVGGGVCEAELRKLADAVPEPARIEMLGETQNQRVIELMGQADVFVLPCRITASGDRDGIPVVLMEAMARGRCVIAGDLETIRELVEDQVSGILIPPGDQSELERVLTSLAADRSRIDLLGQAGRRRVKEEFSLDLNAARMRDKLASHGLVAAGKSLG